MEKDECLSVKLGSVHFYHCAFRA